MKFSTQATCRRNHIVILPCNYVKDGFCGEDAKPCKLIATRLVKVGGLQQ